MSHYFQLLGSDTPNGYGGCCYYGPLDHPAFLEAAASAAPTSTPADSLHNSSGAFLQLTSLLETRDDVSEQARNTGADAPATTPAFSPLHTNPEEELASRSLSSAAPAAPFADGKDTESSTATGTSAVPSPAAPWNWSSYLQSPRPAWPTAGPLYPTSLLHPTPLPDTTAASTATTAASSSISLHPLMTDTGSSGSEGYIFFNCPEGAQRFSSEANIKLKKVRCFCFTRWGCTNTANSVASAVGASSAAMGLPGMLFTINDAGSRQATFFGPSAGTSLSHKNTFSSPSSTGGTTALDSAPCEGLRGFLSALRFHYFQYRPMIFRQLHGAAACHDAMRCAPAIATTTRAAGAAADLSTAHGATTGNEVQFTEVASTESLVSSAEPFFFATVPLSGQSLLVAFRVSGSCTGGHHAECTQTTSQETTGEASSDLATGGADNRINEEAHRRSSSGTTTPGSASYCVPDSSGVVLGYAVVVAPGAAFDAAKARALGVRSGPKYGQLKQGISVEADGDDDAGAMLSKAAAKKKKKGGGGERGEAAVADTPNTALPVAMAEAAAPAERRVVHPHEVMRPTTATRHAYVSLVLDGDAPSDVQRALSCLLGGTSGASTEEGGTTGEGEGALLALLRSAFPHLAYYSEDGGSSASPQPTGQLHTNFVRHPRQLVVRHVTHVQPMSYFEDFWRSSSGAQDTALCVDSGQRLNEKADGTVRAGTTPAAAVDNRVYAAYNDFVFANVARRSGDAAVREAVRVGLYPSLSFTLADVAEHEDDETDSSSGGGGSNVVDASLATRGVRTWHLFSSHIQRHFTAFPTALVHRYHLHHLAPSLFPLHGLKETGSSVGSTNNSNEEVQRPAVEAPVSYWPYSLKLRCVPEAALQLQRKGAFTAGRSSGVDAVAATTAAAAGAPRKRGREEGTAADAGSSSATKSLAANVSRHLSVVDGQTSLLPYPTKASALSLLSSQFLASVAPPPASPMPLAADTTSTAAEVQEGTEKATAASAVGGGGALGFLGTGSAVPSKYRNVSGTYLELFLPACCFGDGGAAPEDGARLRRGVVILDFGEGSCGQLASLCEGVREGVVGEAASSSIHHSRSAVAPEVLSEPTPTSSQADCALLPPSERDDDSAGDRLRRFVLDIVLVFISHAHADHHLGLLSLLTLRHHFLAQRPTTPAVAPSAPKLLVVCPAEVYQFVMDAWGGTAPYASWLHAECCFEQMPPPLRGVSTRSADAAAAAAGEGPDGTTVSSASEGEKGTTPVWRDAAMEQHVVAVPRLEALLRRWNDCIAQRAGVNGDAATAGWWAAEVITVDHPANAHALLLRFPFCSTTAAETKATSSLPTQRLVPDSSRVFLFSGDTRPSAFLVERSHAFARRRRVHHHGDGSDTTAPVFILLHEATFGPGFEGEAVRKKHSTLPEALQIGAAVKAEFVVLNHFSQRYPKLPGLAEEQLGGRSTELLCQRRPRGGTAAGAAAADGVAGLEEEEKSTLRCDGDATCDVALDETNAEGVGESDQDGERCAASAAVSPYANMSFAFDLMSVSFTDMQRGVVPRLTPALVRLLEEYDSWGVSTTHRMRTARPSGGSSGAEKGKKQPSA